MRRQLSQTGKRGFTLVELMIVVAMTGILAAIAIPAFAKYIRRSKTVEATMNVRRLYDSSVAYFESEHALQNGTIQPRQFPATKAWSPGTRGVCCSDAGQKCNPAVRDVQWQDPTWMALNFSISDPFYFSYQYESGGVDLNAAFTVSAGGDLDCDGARFSLFQRVGFIQNNNVSGGGLYTADEEE